MLFFLVFIFFVLIAALWRIVYLIRLSNSLKSEWQKWEREYWMLRGSSAINDDYEIHLSWLPRREYCIFKKKD